MTRSPLAFVPRLAYLTALAILTAALAAPATRAAEKPEAPGEFGVMLGMFRLEGEAKARFMDKVHAWEKEVEAWHGSDKYKQMEALKAEARKLPENDPKRQELEGKYKSTQEEYWAMRVRTRAAIIATLSAEQQQAWIAETLWGRIRGAFKRAELTEVQVAQIKGLCAADAAAYMKEKPALIQEDPYLRTLNDRRDSVVEHAREQVLTDAQRAKVPSRAKPAATQAAR